MPAASEEGLYSNLRAAIGVWCVWPRLKGGNAWLLLGGHLVVTLLARVSFGLLLVDPILEFYLVRGGGEDLVVVVVKILGSGLLFRW
jgi:hypothetical protein